MSRAARLCEHPSSVKIANAIGADLPGVARSDLRDPVARWLAAFADALEAPDDGSLAALLLPEAHWRDLMVFTCGIQTVSGGPSIAAALRRHRADTRAAGFAIDPARTPPSQATRAGRPVVEAFFRFETAVARAQGVVRLDPETLGEEAPKAWTLFTAVDELKGFEENIGSRRPSGEAYSRDFRGPNWLDRRQASAAYTDREPAVLVVGGGQAGLSIAARLGPLGVDALVVDRWARIGDNWRHRYHALTLHNQVQVNHLPYMPFPPNFPTYIPKDKLAGWFEAYAEAMELNVWTGTEFAGGRWDSTDGCWEVALRHADGATRTLRPRHIVMATGASDVPHIPDLPGLERFEGRTLHAGQYRSAEGCAGRRALVIGTGTSGHDIAQDLHSNGVEVTLLQRGPTLVLNVEPAAQLPYATYNEGRTLDECDLLAASTPLALFEASHRELAVRARELDRALLDDLTRAGFNIDTEDETGWQFMYLTRGGGYYFNVGCSNLIVDGRIPVLQMADVEAFVEEGARMKDGAVVAADLIVLATGYQGQQHVVRTLFGDAVADRLGPIWGFDRATQELRNMFTRTAQPGLWFHAGSFAQCRIYSKYLALQIKAEEEGLVPSGREENPRQDLLPA
jgi:cation diffusion facilitator CzcD-associated flavoprotein CzcO